jgi:hypothetical protein
MVYDEREADVTNSVPYGTFIEGSLDAKLYEGRRLGIDGNLYRVSKVTRGGVDVLVYSYLDSDNKRSVTTMDDLTIASLYPSSEK